ncbi:MAG: roadblock/LC7 domain-containing protein [Candidatus Asgardarchaeia archaeon]
MSEEVFKSTLSEILKRESGVDSVILVDRTGLTISHVSRSQNSPEKLENVGAIASAIFGASEEQGKGLQIGDLKLLTSEYGKGKVFIASCGQGVLCVVTNPSVNMGMIRFLINKVSKKVSKLLEKLDSYGSL